MGIREVFQPCRHLLETVVVVSQRQARSA
jgi:hypothetical protein